MLLKSPQWDTESPCNKTIFKENKQSWRTTIYSNAQLWTISTWAVVCCGKKPTETFYRIFHSKWDYWEDTVFDKKCLDNVTDFECHSKLPWPEEITAEGRRYKVKHWCLRIAETYINTRRSMKSIQEHRTISWLFFVKHSMACKLSTVLDFRLNSQTIIMNLIISQNLGRNNGLEKVV